MANAVRRQTPKSCKAFKLFETAYTQNLDLNDLLYFIRRKSNKKPGIPTSNKLICGVNCMLRFCQGCRCT